MQCITGRPLRQGKDEAHSLVENPICFQFAANFLQWSPASSVGQRTFEAPPIHLLSLHTTSFDCQRLQGDSPSCFFELLLINVVVYIRRIVSSSTFCRYLLSGNLRFVFYLAPSSIYWRSPLDWFCHSNRASSASVQFMFKWTSYNFNEVHSMNFILNRIYRIEYIHIIHMIDW